MESDKQLTQVIGRIGLGDRHAFKKLYDATAPRLLSILRRMVHDHQQSEDLLQEVYIKVWHQAGSYRADKSSPLTWMGSIARYTAIDFIRKQERQPTTVAESVVTEVAAPKTSPTNIEQQHLSNCIQLLSSDQRNAIIAAYLGGYTHSELSHRYNSPLGTIKSWIRRGLRSLKECLSI